MWLRFAIIFAAVGAVLWGVGVAVEARSVSVAVAACSSATVRWEPETPKQGALFRVRVAGVATGANVSGSVLGESLHFTADSIRESLAAIPINGPDSLTIVIRCTIDSQRDSLTARVASSRGDYPIERLRVAPAFGRPPDSATAARIERESQRAAGVAAGAHATPRLWIESFAVPRESRITSGFGGGREYNGAITSRHMGTDFAGATGAEVLAVNRGVVRIVDAFFYGGNVVYLDHGAGVSSAYLHLSEQLVAAGDTVTRGQVIGRVGATGRVTGPHLHLIVRYGSITVDPMSLFAIAGDSSGTQK
jgi:murein DD-endopeptidase MepM/ murein hydrolase activator NlpD